MGTTPCAAACAACAVDFSRSLEEPSPEQPETSASEQQRAATETSRRRARLRATSMPRVSLRAECPACAMHPNGLVPAPSRVGEVRDGAAPPLRGAGNCATSHNGAADNEPPIAPPRRSRESAQPAALAAYSA